MYKCTMWFLPCMWRQISGDSSDPNTETYFMDRAVTPDNQAWAERMGLTSLRFPTAFAFEALFRPQPHLLELQDHLRQEANLIPMNYIGVHIRTGRMGVRDRTRYHPEDMARSFECVVRQEKAMGLPASTPWYFATDHAPAHDTLREWLSNNSLPESKAVDLTMVNGSISHIAKQGSLDGETFAYLDFLVLRDALVVAGSESGFNAMAAATGHHRRLIYLPDCLLRYTFAAGDLQSHDNYTRSMAPTTVAPPANV